MDGNNSKNIDFSNNSTNQVVEIAAEDVLTRGYDYKISELISLAWSKINGFKLYVFLYTIIVSIVNGFLPSWLQIFFAIFITPILTAGLLGQAIKHYKKQPISFSGLFDYFNLALPIILFSLAHSILLILGFALFIIPGIYLSICYTLVILIIINHPQISFWQAMELSRKLIAQRWWKNFGLFALVGLIVVISALPLGIGLIWTIPLMYMTMVCLYDRILGLSVE